MTTATPDHIREQAAQLMTEGLSNRAIAAQLGIGKDTVRRWRNAPAQTTAPAAPPPAPAAQPECATAPSGAPAPRPGMRRLTVDVDAEHLDVLRQAGLDPHSAITRAVRLLADAYLCATDPDQHVIAHTIGTPTHACTPTPHEDLL